MGNEGKIFEKNWRGSIPSSIYHYRLKDDTSGFAGIGNPCDVFIYNYPYFYLQELKTTKGKSISFDKIRKCQMDGLEAASKYKGIHAGVIINFREHDVTFYISIEKLLQFKETSGKKSINIDDLKKVGLVVGQTLRRKYYNYHIEELLKEIITYGHK